MASAFQGFARNLNLLENSDDRDVLNNLGGEPIADDIILFINNLRNFSFLDVSVDNITVSDVVADDAFIVFNAITQKFVYTDKTKITVNGITYYVGDSNSLNKFRLYTSEDLLPVNLVRNPPTGVYRRSDTVTAEDIRRLVPIRDKVLENISISKFRIINPGATDVINQDFYNSMVRVYYNLVSNGYPTTLKDYFDAIERQLDGFEFTKQKSINSEINFLSTEKLSLAGNFIVKDPGGVNSTSVTSIAGNTGSPPGIFILNTDDNTAKRIFSGNENSWTDQGTYLEVDSAEIVVGNLVFESPPSILRKNNLPVIVTPITTGLTPENTVVNDYSHYVSVFVNGEEYFLLLK